jgi:hypothetical protein
VKVYLASGAYYEKQADVPKGQKFEAVEFPFGASPKADFIAWLNEQQAGIVKLAKIATDVNAPIVVGEPYDIALPVSKPLDARTGPPTTADIAADRERTAETLRQIDIEEAIQKATLPALASYASQVAWRFQELGK